MAGACCRSLLGRRAGRIGRCVAPKTPRWQPGGYISDSEPLKRGVQLVRMSRVALSRNAKADSIPDWALSSAYAASGTARVDVRGPGAASSRPVAGTAGCMKGSRHPALRNCPSPQEVSADRKVARTSLPPHAGLAQRPARHFPLAGSELFESLSTRPSSFR